MNRQWLIGSVMGAVAVTAVGVMATESNLFGEYAEVVSVEPVMKTVTEPREVCGEEWIDVQKPVKDPHQITGTVAGAVVGALLGNQVGGGSGKDIATASGAVAGGYAGNKLQEKIQEGNTEQRQETRCQVVYDSREIQDGFEVTYLLNGLERVVVMDYHPGHRIRLKNGEPDIEA